MKRMVLLIFTILFTYHVSAKNGKGLAFNKVTHNFGNASQNEKLSTTFYYTNKTGQTIKIKKVHSTCGCTVPDISKRELKPGQRGKMEVVFNTGKYRGTVTKSIYFETQPMLTPPPKVNVQANIIPDVYLDPPNIFIPRDFDKETFNIKVKLLSERYTNFQIQEMEYDSEYLQIAPSKLKENNTLGYLLDVTIFLEKKSSSSSEKILIYTDIPSQKIIPLRIYHFD
ncbi:MAG: DUF1573 domain-containing protein [Spirochaetes bacterium]|nr:DUF1573 domain-containing protein [Spirochaetota bacterium]